MRDMSNLPVALAEALMRTCEEPASINSIQQENENDHKKQTIYYFLSNVRGIHFDLGGFRLLYREKRKWVQFPEHLQSHPDLIDVIAFLTELRKPYGAPTVFPLYCWNCTIERDHYRTKAEEENMATCCRCGGKDWIEDYLIVLGQEIVGGESAARRSYQAAKQEYYEQIQRYREE